MLDSEASGDPCRAFAKPVRSAGGGLESPEAYQIRSWPSARNLFPQERGGKRVGMGRGPNLVGCGGDKTVRFHTADNGNNFRNFAGATDFMFAAASDDEMVVISAGQDGVLRIWNGTNAQVIKLFEPTKPADKQQAQAK